MTKQELINEIDKRIIELKESYNSYITLNDIPNASYFNGAINECYANKYLLESYFEHKLNTIEVYYLNFNQYKIDCKRKNNEGFYVTNYYETEEFIVVKYEDRLSI